MLEFVRDAFVRARDRAFITGRRDYPESCTKPRGKIRRMPWYVFHQIESNAIRFLQIRRFETGSIKNCPLKYYSSKHVLTL